MYRCEDLHLHAPAAVKIRTNSTEDARLRFFDEGRILANLTSPHLVQVFAVGELNPGNSESPGMPRCSSATGTATCEARLASARPETIGDDEVPAGEIPVPY